MARSIVIDGIERTDVIARIGSRFTSAAFMGQSALSEVTLEDLTGTQVEHFDVAALKIVEVIENATASPTTIYRGRIGNHSVVRGHHKIGNARDWQLHLQDYNWDLGGFRNLGWFRPAETDVERVQALRLAFLNGASSSSPRRRNSTALSGTYISTDNPVDLPAKRYTDYELEAILREIAEQAGKTFFVTVDGELFYDLHSSVAYAASLSVHPDTADGEEIFAPLVGIESYHGGQEILTGGALRYGDEQRYVEGSNVFLGEGFHDKWEGVLSAHDIETEAEAQAYFEQIIRYRTNEDIGYSFTLSLRADQIDMIKPGQALTIGHPAVNAGASQDLRIVQLQYEPDAPAHYLVHVELGYPRVPAPRRGDVRRKAPPSPARSIAEPDSSTWLPGDILIVHASQDVQSIPGGATGFTGIGVGGSQAQGTMGSRMFYRVLQDGDTTVGDDWDAGSLACAIYRGQHASDPIGDADGTGGNGATVDYDPITCEGSGSHIILAGHHTTEGNDRNPPSGYVNRLNDGSTTVKHFLHDSDGIESGFAGASVTDRVAGDGWQTTSLELKAASSGSLRFVAAFHALDGGDLPPQGVTPSVEEGDLNADLVGAVSGRWARPDHTHTVLRTIAPTVNDDANDGYTVGTRWLVVNSVSAPTTVSAIYTLLKNTAGAAEWELELGLDLSGINFLVGTATGLLSNEIVVGTTPQGQLGGTWGSPTVDDNHATGTHASFQAAAEAAAAAALATHAGTPHGSGTHSESLTDGNENFIFAGGDIVTVVGVPD